MPEYPVYITLCVFNIAYCHTLPREVYETLIHPYMSCNMVYQAVHVGSNTSGTPPTDWVPESLIHCLACSKEVQCNMYNTWQCRICLNILDSECHLLINSERRPFRTVQQNPVKNMYYSYHVFGVLHRKQWRSQDIWGGGSVTFSQYVIGPQGSKVNVNLLQQRAWGRRYPEPGVNDCTSKGPEDDAILSQGLMVAQAKGLGMR